MIRGRDVGIVDALDDVSPLLGFVGVALVMTDSWGKDVKVFVAVGLIVVSVFKLLAMLDGNADVGLAELSGVATSVAELPIVFDDPAEVIPEVGLKVSALLGAAVVGLLPVVGPVAVGVTLVSVAPVFVGRPLVVGPSVGVVRPGVVVGTSVVGPFVPEFVGVGMLESVGGTTTDVGVVDGSGFTVGDTIESVGDPVGVTIESVGAVPLLDEGKVIPDADGVGETSGVLEATSVVGKSVGAADVIEAIAELTGSVVGSWADGDGVTIDSASDVGACDIEMPLFASEVGAALGAVVGPVTPALLVG